jgi:hypothetical protein
MINTTVDAVAYSNIDAEELTALLVIEQSLVTALTGCDAMQLRCN